MGFERALSISRARIQTPTLTPTLSVQSLPSFLPPVVISIQYLHALIDALQPALTLNQDEGFLSLVHCYVPGAVSSPWLTEGTQIILTR